MIVQSGIICPSHDYADDMFLGIIVKRLNITITHIPQLHQVDIHQPHCHKVVTTM